MRRTIATAITVLALAACSPYDTPADAAPAPTTTTTAACDRACWDAIVQRQRDERLWWAEVVKRQKREAEARRIARIYAFAHAVEQARLARLTGHCYIEHVRVCDGPGLLPFHIVWRESRMNPRARNPRSSAGGYAQVLIGTMRDVCPTEARRYGNAANAPVAVQVECVRRLIAKYGLAPWRLTA